MPPAAVAAAAAAAGFGASPAGPVGPGMLAQAAMPMGPGMFGGNPMAMYPQAYGQTMMQQPMGQMPQAYGQMGHLQAGYPKMNPDGSFGGISHPGLMTMGYSPALQPGMLPAGFDRQPSKRNFLQFSYMDDFARCHGWMLSQLARVYHERNNALKVCIPSAAFAVFFVVIAIVMVVNVAIADVDATALQCQVLEIKLNEIGRDGGGATARVYRPTLHVSVAGKVDEHVVTRYREPGDFEVGSEEGRRYLSQFCVGCIVPCYQFDDGALQLDSAEYTSIWSYVIMVIFLLSAFVCCCLWLTSGTFACCSPLITVTLQS